MINVPIIETPWKLTLNDRICIRSMFRLSEETLLLGPPFHLHVTYGTLNLTLSLLFIRPRTNQYSRPRPKAQGPIDNFGLLSLQLCIWIINLEFQVSHYLISRVFHK